MLRYLATPYTHKSRRVENERARLAAILAGQLVKKGYHIICPVVMCHPMNRLVGLEGKFDYWREFDTKVITVCSEFWIGCIPGWRDSNGIADETTIAARLNMTPHYVNPLTLEIAREPFDI